MRTSFRHGTIYITFASIIFVISGYLINILLGRYLGPASYGVYGVIISLMTVINLTQTAGLPQAVAKFIAEDEKKIDSILRYGLVIQLVSTFAATALFLLFAEQFATILKDKSLTPYLFATAAIFPFYGLYSLYLNYYNGLHYFKKQAQLNVIYSLTKLIAVIILAYFFRLYGVIVGFVIAPLIALLFSFHLPKSSDNQFPYKKLIYFSIPLVGFAIFSNLLQSIDLFFIKALIHSDKITGFYAADQNIAELPYYGIISIATVLFPNISRHVSQKLTNETKNLINKSLRFSLLLVAPCIFLLSATSLQILQLLYSPMYSQGSQALAILVIGSGFFTLFTILTTIISGSGSPFQSSTFAFIGVLLSSFFCLILIPKLGINGAALSTTLAAFIVMICAGIIVYQKFNALVNIKSIIKILIASVIIYLIAKIIVLPLLFLPFLYFILFILYCGLLILLKEISSDDIIMIKSLIPESLRQKGNHE